MGNLKKLTIIIEFSAIAKTMSVFDMKWRIFFRFYNLNCDFLVF